MKSRRAWLRDTRVVSIVDTFVLSALTSLLLVRLYLFVTGYPQAGGGGIHVAHMVWGGLLMLVAMIIAISFVSVTARWITAVVGGIGFGLFVDEIGKFLTSDNNYFFRPSAALIYGVLAVIFVFSRSITRRTGFAREEYVANGLDVLKESAVRNFDAMEKRRAENCLNARATRPSPRP